MRRPPSLWLFVLVAAIVAVLALAAGLLWEGVGVPVAIALSTAWVALAHARRGSADHG